MSEFAQKVFNVVKRIPRGSTMSYNQVAHAIGSPKAARAVARVLASNFDPHIPCHRVIRTDGGMGGYNRGGIAAKQKILAEEQLL